MDAKDFKEISMIQFNTLTLITGPMFSGKSTELIRCVEKYIIGGYKVLVIKPGKDTRQRYVKSRFGKELECKQAEHADDIVSMAEPYEVVAIDEAQFLPGIHHCVDKLLKNGKRVFVAGLDVQSEGKWFGDVFALLAWASEVIKLTAVCEDCKNDSAIRTVIRNGPQGDGGIGNAEKYKPVCITCFQKYQ